MFKIQYTMPLTLVALFAGLMWSTKTVHKQKLYFYAAISAAISAAVGVI